MCREVVAKNSSAAPNFGPTLTKDCVAAVYNGKHHAVDISPVEQGALSEINRGWAV